MSEKLNAIPKAAQEAYETIEDAVVETYKKVEEGAVSTYEKVEDFFVERCCVRTARPSRKPRTA